MKRSCCLYHRPSDPSGRKADSQKKAAEVGLREKILDILIEADHWKDLFHDDKKKEAVKRIFLRIPEREK